jgi:hypothetical protein
MVSSFTVYDELRKIKAEKPELFLNNSELEIALSAAEQAAYQATTMPPGKIYEHNKRIKKGGMKW